MILRGNNIHKEYRHAERTLYVLKGIDISVDAGEVVAIVGPSGAGKSTLLHILGGLDTPTAGSVELAGQDVYAVGDSKRARLRNEKVGFIFQFYHLLPEFTALENVMLPALIQADSRRTADFEKKAVALLDRVGLAERRTHKPYQLSGGEQQRVAIARALINQPAIIFCDEPTGNLDSASGTGIISLLMDLNTANGQTLVIVTHDDELAAQAHRIIPLRDGMLVSPVGINRNNMQPSKAK